MLGIDEYGCWLCGYAGELVLYALYVSGLRIPFEMTIDNVGQLVLLQGGRTRLRT